MHIDQKQYFLRRLELPEQNIPTELADGQVSDVSLSIEFDGIQSNHPIAWEGFELDAPQHSVLVDHFVPTPPSIETNGLGARIPAFTLNDPSGSVVYDSSQRKPRVESTSSTAAGGSLKTATVLMWLADHPSSRIAAEQLAQSWKSLSRNQSLAKRIRFLPIWAEPSPPNGQSFATLTQAWQLPGKLALDRDALGRDLFQIMEAPSLIVLDEQNRVQIRETRSNPLLGQILPQLLERLCQGEDLAQSLVAEANDSRARYAADLRAALAIDGKTSQAALMGDSGNFRPLIARLSLLHEFEQASRTVASALDSQNSLWTLGAGWRADKA